MGKGLKALNCLLYNIKKYCLKPKVSCQLLDAFVGSILSFSLEAWGFGKCKEIERIHLKFCKTLLKVKSSTCNMGVYGELGRYPLYILKHKSFATLTKLLAPFFGPKQSLSDN